MAALEEVGRMLGGGRIGGRHSTSMSAARAGLKVEVTELKKLSKEFDVIRLSVSNLRKEMDDLHTSASKAGSAVHGVATGGTGGAYSTGTPRPPSAPPPGSPGGTPGPPPGGPGAPPGGPSAPLGAFAKMRAMFQEHGISMGAGVAAGAGLLAGQAVGAMDRRFDSMRDKASDADRLSIRIQQQTGQTQLGVFNQMRKPLANYRLGADGVSQVLAFQTQYGSKFQNGLTGIGSAIEGIRALSGYTKSTGAVLQDQQTLENPEVANRMYRMLGVSPYKIGGGMNDPITMRQQVTQRLGLNNSRTLKGAKSQGSPTRAIMTDAGIPQEVQDEILDYAQSNVEYQKKTGTKNLYDPRKRADQKTMGIDENFASQQEKTDQMRSVRDEDYMRRNIDNMAALERSNQSLIRALGSLEDRMSPLIGARGSARNFMKIGGRILQIGGLATAAGLGWTGVGAGVGLGAAAIGTAMTGDPPEGSSGSTGGHTGGHSDSSNDDNIKVPFGYKGGSKTLNEIKAVPNFNRMNSKMQERLLAMFRANPNVGIGGGMRSSSEQETLFRSRYRKTGVKTGIFWEGSYWEHVSGPAAAPPGRSMHEIGLAADLVGDMGWMNSHASEFGLKHFAGVNSEPWHVQPSDLPSSRSEYEKGGAAWGTDGGFKEDSSFGDGKRPTVTGVEHEPDPRTAGMASAGLSSYAGMSISEIIASLQFGAAGRLAGGGGGYTSGSKGRGSKPGAIGDTPMTTGTTAQGQLAGVEVARAAAGAGFSKNDLVKMVAIAKRESKWNARAYNGNLKTGDQSYGLWQLNTLNSPKGGQMGDLVNSILGQAKGNMNFDALFDPNTNARVAHEFYRRNGNTTRPWGGYKGMSDTHGADQYMAEATQAVQQAGLGDPMPQSSMGSGSASASSSTHISHAPTYQISIAPVMQFYGTPSTPDLRRMTQEVGTMLREQVRQVEMRSN